MRLIALMFLSLTSLGFVGVVSAQNNKVVVVPLAGDDAPRQLVTIGEGTNIASDGCYSEFYRTGSSAVQLNATALAAISLTELESDWFAAPQYSVNLVGSWQLMNPPSQYVVSGGAAGTWSQSVNKRDMVLEPNTTYQFRVKYNAAPEHTESMCNLTLDFSLVTPDVVTPITIVLLKDQAKEAEPQPESGIGVLE